MAEVSFCGVVQFSDNGLVAAVLSATGFPFYRLVISDDSVRVESRWRLLGPLLPTRSSALAKVVSARLRGSFIIVNLPDDAWWTIGHTGIKSTAIMRELEVRGVAVTRD